MNPDPSRRKQESFQNSEASLNQISTSLQCHMQFLLHGTLGSIIIYHSQVNYGMNLLLQEVCIPLSLKEELHMILKTSGHLAKRSLGTWEPFFFSPLRIWIRLLY